MKLPRTGATARPQLAKADAAAHPLVNRPNLALDQTIQRPTRTRTANNFVSVGLLATNPLGPSSLGRRDPNPPRIARD